MMCACADAVAAGRACVGVGAGLLAAVAEQASVHRSAAHKRAKARGSVMSFGARVAESSLVLSRAAAVRPGNPNEVPGSRLQRSLRRPDVGRATPWHGCPDTPCAHSGAVTTRLPPTPGTDASSPWSDGTGYATARATPLLDRDAQCWRLRWAVAQSWRCPLSPGCARAATRRI